MSEGYSEEVYKHFRSPQNVGEIESPSAIGKVGNPQCGDIMYIYIKVNDETKIIEECHLVVINLKRKTKTEKTYEQEILNTILLYHWQDIRQGIGPVRLAGLPCGQE